jgi:hypothetical protein
MTAAPGRALEPKSGGRELRKGARAIEFPVWRAPGGEPLGCVEKIKVLNENLQEIYELAQAALEDAVLMGCDEGQLRETLGHLVRSLENPFRGKR